MQFSSVILAALMGSAAMAAPIAEPDRNMMVAGASWTMQTFTRTCNSADTSCKYNYTINPHDVAATPCSYTVTAASKASRASYNNVKCGNFVISSNWSGQFGDGKGFQTLAVVRNRYVPPVEASVFQVILC